MAERMFLEAVAAATQALDEKDYRKAIVAAEKARDNFEIDYDCNEDVQNAAGRLGEIMSEALAMIGKYEEAIQQGLSTVRMYPHRFEGPLALARVYQRARQLEEARQWCGKAYSLNPKSTTVRITMKAIETDIKIENQLRATRMASPQQPSTVSLFAADTSANPFRLNGVVPVLESNISSRVMTTMPTPRQMPTPLPGLNSSATTPLSGSSSFQQVRAAGSPTSAVIPLARATPFISERRPVLPVEVPLPAVIPFSQGTSSTFYRQQLWSRGSAIIIASGLGIISLVLAFISFIHSYFGTVTIIGIPFEVFTSSLLTCTILAVNHHVRRPLQVHSPQSAKEDEVKRRVTAEASATDEALARPLPTGTGQVTLRAPRTLQRRSVVH